MFDFCSDSDFVYYFMYFSERKRKKVLNRNVLPDHEYVYMQDIVENVNSTNKISDVLSNKGIYRYFFV